MDILSICVHKTKESSGMIINFSLSQFIISWKILFSMLYEIYSKNAYKVCDCLASCIKFPLKYNFSFACI